MTSKLWSKIRFRFLNGRSTRKQRKDAKAATMRSRVYIGPEQYLMYRSNYSYRNRLIDKKSTIS